MRQGQGFSALDKSIGLGELARVEKTILAPHDCSTMAEVRAGVDQLDRELVGLLARRFAYMRAAARIKPDRSAVRDEERKAAVIAAASAAAHAAGLPASDIAVLWDHLVEASIAYELEEWERSRAAT